MEDFKLYPDIDLELKPLRELKKRSKDFLQQQRDDIFNQYKNQAKKQDQKQKETPEMTQQSFRMTQASFLTSGNNFNRPMSNDPSAGKGGAAFGSGEFSLEGLCKYTCSIFIFNRIYVFVIRSPKEDQAAQVSARSGQVQQGSNLEAAVAS